MLDASRTKILTALLYVIVNHCLPFIEKKKSRDDIVISEDIDG